ncbi:hypothetical protein ERJ75_000996600 [Trypanosoma vivax]|uniref:Uncharacterized protein n=1 Tax=Trypanosoma vivax (strain Y486) TaxID=1055687 RepID=G0UAS7_TRYVY|nr:hypothetical protein TRVL_02149 [Trypanosoma vivax]KAH8611372.1 hypothetical protein ERJ75_000996600 [Trypanosoma vivax]CCC52913.1 hypothetical protein TVY486_1103970 [Trypanosoma vivax Y486]
MQPNESKGVSFPFTENVLEVRQKGVAVGKPLCVVDGKHEMFKEDIQDSVVRQRKKPSSARYDAWGGDVSEMPGGNAPLVKEALEETDVMSFSTTASNFRAVCMSGKRCETDGINRAAGDEPSQNCQASSPMLTARHRMSYRWQQHEECISLSADEFVASTYGDVSDVASVPSQISKVTVPPSMSAHEDSAMGAKGLDTDTEDERRRSDDGEVFAEEAEGMPSGVTCRYSRQMCSRISLCKDALPTQWERLPEVDNHVVLEQPSVGHFMILRNVD